MADRTSEFDISNWKLKIRPLPLEPSYTPVGGAPLADMDDDTLLNAPPHMIAHIQRTAAQGGLQVVSPRQIPFSQLLGRTVGETRMLGDHVVGSIASPMDEWPTLDNADFSHLLPDEPIAPYREKITTRNRTRTKSLTAATHEMADPVLACLVKGRAVVDILRRDDVQGGAEEYIDALASAWGISRTDIDEMDAFTLGLEGPLLRHAIKADDVYPMCYAPTHVRRCVSVGVSEVNRTYLPPDSAMDWRRFRVHAEAIFILTCTIEGIPIRYIAASPPPGNPSAPGNRRHVLCFQPAAATAWSFSPDTFSILPGKTAPNIRASAIPREVLRALSRHVEISKPMSYAMSIGHSLMARKSSMVETPQPAGETIGNAYRKITRTLAIGSARGKTAAASVRSMIYTTLEAADMHTRLRIARFIKVAQSECKTHLGLDDVPDSLIHKLARRFLKFGEIVRLKVVGEATRRGHTAEDWWCDILAQAPDSYRSLTEGTTGWATVAMWLVFREPTDRWRKLANAVHYQALRTVSLGTVKGVRLPAMKGSAERLEAACRHIVAETTSAYGGYYKGVADVGLALADVADEMKRTRTAGMLREAAYMWVLRARCFRGTNVELLEHDRSPRSKNHILLEADPLNVVLVPAPYQAFEAYKTHVAKSTILRNSYKVHIAGLPPNKISEVFRKWNEELVPCKDSTVTRYLNRPRALHDDMENAWAMLSTDVDRVIEMMAKEVAPLEDVAPSRIPVPVTNMSFVQPEEPQEGLTYWHCIAFMDVEQVEWVERVLETLGRGYEDAYSEMTFVSVEALIKDIMELEKLIPVAPSTSSEAIR